MNRERFFNASHRTMRSLLFVCSGCDSSFETEAPLDARQLRRNGFELKDGAWWGLCPECEANRVDASNAEHDALKRASAQIVRAGHNAGPLTFIHIPEGEGFAREGEHRFGFWAVSGNYTDQGFEAFMSTAGSIVERLNVDRNLGLVFNVNADATQAIVHGVVD